MKSSLLVCAFTYECCSEKWGHGNAASCEAESNERLLPTSWAAGRCERVMATSLRHVSAYEALLRPSRAEGYVLLVMGKCEVLWRRKAVHFLGLPAFPFAAPRYAED